MTREGSMTIKSRKLKVQCIRKINRQKLKSKKSSWTKFFEKENTLYLYFSNKTRLSRSVATVKIYTEKGK